MWDSRGSRSDLPREVPYARFAVEAVANGQANRVNAFVRLCNQVRVDRLDDLEVVHRLEHDGGSTTSLEELGRLLDNPHLACWYALQREQRALKLLIGRTLDKPQSGVNDFALIAEVMRADPQMRDELDRLLWHETARAIKAGNVSRGRALLENLYPLVFHQQPTWPFDRLLHAKPDEVEPEKVSWPMREYLLPNLLSAIKRSADGGMNAEPRLDPWLAAPVDQWENLLNLGLPEFAQKRTVRVAALRPSQPGRERDDARVFEALGPTSGATRAGMKYCCPPSPPRPAEAMKPCSVAVGGSSAQPSSAPGRGI